MHVAANDEPSVVSQLDLSPLGGVVAHALPTGRFVQLSTSSGSHLAVLATGAKADNAAAIILLFSAGRPPSVLQRLNEHAMELRHALDTTVRLAEMYPKSAVNALGAMGFAAAAVTRSAAIISANAAFLRWLEATPVASRGTNQLLLTGEGADRNLLTAIQMVDSRGARQLIPGRAGAWDNVLHVLPLDRPRDELLTHAAALVVVTPAVDGAVDTALMAKLFELTPSESAIALKLAAGQTVEQIAAENGRSVLTVRSQTKRLLAKTGARRQADLIRTLMRLLPGL